MSEHLGNGTANLHGAFPTSEETSELVLRARKSAALFMNTVHNSIVFGANMTSLTFSLSRALGRTWLPDDEILLTALDHDANFTPWQIAAEEAGCKTVIVPVDEKGDLSVESFQQRLTEKTRLVAFTLASNATGSITPAVEMTRLAHDAGALVYVDAVHFAPHRLIDIQALDCDFLVCSPYKFFGPHMGMLYGRPDLLESIEPYKVRPAPNHAPDRWESGTANFEGIAGLQACIQYHADLAEQGLNRKGLEDASAMIEAHEGRLTQQFLDGISDIPGLQLYGQPTNKNRTSTFALAHTTLSSHLLAEKLAKRGIFVWSGGFYANELIQSLGLQERGGLLRVGFVHYNTEEEVVRVLGALEDISTAGRT